MNVQIQSVKFDADKRLVEFVENKMDKLDRFAERSTGAEVILRLDKDFEKGNKIATVTLHMPGEDLVACHQSRSFEESVDEAIDAIKRQLDKFKGKLHFCCAFTLSRTMLCGVRKLMARSYVRPSLMEGRNGVVQSATY